MHPALNTFIPRLHTATKTSVWTKIYLRLHIVYTVLIREGGHTKGLLKYSPKESFAGSMIPSTFTAVEPLSHFSLLTDPTPEPLCAVKQAAATGSSSRQQQQAAAAPVPDGSHARSPGKVACIHSFIRLKRPGSNRDTADHGR